MEFIPTQRQTSEKTTKHIYKMSSTQQRLISAFVIISILALCIWKGVIPSKVLSFIFGLLICEELFTNFFKIKRFSSDYFLSLLAYVAIIVFDSFFVTSLNIESLWLNITLVSAFITCGMLGLLLLNIPTISSKNLFEKISPISLAFFVLVIFRIIDHMSFPYALIGLLILVSSADAGAWFFGKNFGKNPLWKSVSPNKTREGAIAGIICTSLFMTIYWKWVFPTSSYSIALFFIILAIVSILGDLVQSKLKRLYSIKDSSSMIPGHGGFFDRADSILFTAPFYLLLIKLL